MSVDGSNGVRSQGQVVLRSAEAVDRGLIRADRNCFVAFGCGYGSFFAGAAERERTKPHRQTAYREGIATAVRIIDFGDRGAAVKDETASACLRCQGETASCTSYRSGSDVLVETLTREDDFDIAEFVCYCRDADVAHTGKVALGKSYGVRDGSIVTRRRCYDLAFCQFAADTHDLELVGVARVAVEALVACGARKVVVRRDGSRNDVARAYRKAVSLMSLGNFIVANLI